MEKRKKGASTDNKNTEICESVKGQGWQGFPACIVVLQNVLEQYKKSHSQQCIWNQDFFLKDRELISVGPG